MHHLSAAGLPVHSKAGTLHARASMAEVVDSQPPPPDPHKLIAHCLPLIKSPCSSPLKPLELMLINSCVLYAEHAGLESFQGHPA
jgi:hypothetical protein